MTSALKETNFELPGQTDLYHGKVREVYQIGNDAIVVITTDRISAFDHILPKGIPYKGAILNGISVHSMEATRDIVPNWIEQVPYPNVIIGKWCNPLPIEMIIRGYLLGSSWRKYEAGDRQICGIKIPDGMHEFEQFPEPLITPTTKAKQGKKDEDISPTEIIEQGLVSGDIYRQLEGITRKLFERGQSIAQERGLILADTKYEFGMYNGKIVLIDEVHTPDSSRYFYDDMHALVAKGERPRQLSKEFVREWLMSKGFQGKPGQQIPHMDDEIIAQISERYQELYKTLTGEDFIPSQFPPLYEMEEKISAILRG